MHNNKRIGLVFDMDGVIVDNHIFHYKSWQVLAKSYNLNLNEEDYRDHMNGRTIGEVVRFLQKDASDEEVKKIGIEKEALYRDLYQPYLTPTKGLWGFLSNAQEHKIPMCIGTSAPEKNVSFTINGLGIGHYFKTILDDRSVTKGKPHPDIYQKCAQSIGLPNEQCIVFEDALAGIEAGKAAGSKVIALATSHERKALNADLVINDFSEIDIQMLYDLF